LALVLKDREVGDAVAAISISSSPIHIHVAQGSLRKRVAKDAELSMLKYLPAKT
jgi:hypothetical protein